MQIILLEDVEKVGLRGDVVDVARGYARNFLLPRRLAEVATPGRVAAVKRTAAERARQEARSAEQAAEIAARLGESALRFDVKAGATGALFGSVTPTDIADEIWRTRKIRVDRRKIGVESIKRIGRYSVPVDVFEGVVAELELLVVPEGGELPPEEELEAAGPEATAAGPEPTVDPGVEPSVEPGVELSVEPSVEPGVEPSVEPTVEPGSSASEPGPVAALEPVTAPAPAEGPSAAEPVEGRAEGEASS